MKFNIVSQNQELVRFCSVLRNAGHDIAIINGEFSPCDIVVYDSSFREQISGITDIIKIEHISDETVKPEKDFCLSFLDIDGAYKIEDGCFLLGKGEDKEELQCDISSHDQPLTVLNYLKNYVDMKHKVKIFNTEAINIHNYCGFIGGDDASNLYCSSKVNIAMNRQSLFRILESGGTPLSNIEDSELPEELTFTDEEDFDKKVEHLLSNPAPDINELRNKVIKTNNPLNQWSNIFDRIGLKKIAKQFIKISNDRTKDLYF